MKRGFNRKEAAEYIGVGATKFDELVDQECMPTPKLIGKRVIWDKKQLDEFFDNLPNRSNDNNSTEWDTVDVS